MHRSADPGHQPDHIASKRNDTVPTEDLRFPSLSPPECDDIPLELAPYDTSQWRQIRTPIIMNTDYPIFAYSGSIRTWLLCNIASATYNRFITVSIIGGVANVPSDPIVKGRNAGWDLGSSFM